MARPQKIAIDYFPLDCCFDDRVNFIEAKHGFAGFTVLIKLWQKIYSSEGYYCCFDEKAKYLFCQQYRIDRNLLNEILTTLLSENIFSLHHYQQYGILTSRGVQKRYFKIVRECKRNPIKINPNFYLLDFLEDKSGSPSISSGFPPEETPVFPEKTLFNSGINQEETFISSGDNSINSGGNPDNSGKTPVETPQIKEKKNKVNKKEIKNKEKILSNSEEKIIVLPEEKEKSSAKKEKQDEGKYGRHTYEVLAERAKNFGR